MTGVFTPEEGLATLRGVARGILALDRTHRPGGMTLPYPTEIQRALDRVVLICLQKGMPPPTGVPDLMAWSAGRTAQDWPFPVIAGALRPDTWLLDPVYRVPTRTCAELASFGSVDGPEQEAAQLLDELENSAPSPFQFRSYRRFLINRPLIISGDNTGPDWDPVAWRRVQHLYEPVQPGYILDDRVTLCPGCGLLGWSTAERLLRCEGELCALDVPVPDGIAPGRIKVLKAALRMFLSLPGRTEQALLARLSRQGIDAVPLPHGGGVHELSEPLLGRKRLRVLDRAEPGIVASVTADDGLVIVLPRRNTAIPGYLTAARKALPRAVEVVPEQELAKWSVPYA